jgi:hypothetical protein
MIPATHRLQNTHNHSFHLPTNIHHAINQTKFTLVSSNCTRCIQITHNSTSQIHSTSIRALKSYHSSQPHSMVTYIWRIIIIATKIRVTPRIRTLTFHNKTWTISITINQRKIPKFEREIDEQ